MLPLGSVFGDTGAVCAMASDETSSAPAVTAGMSAPKMRARLPLSAVEPARFARVALLAPVKKAGVVAAVLDRGDIVFPVPLNSPQPSLRWLQQPLHSATDRSWLSAGLILE
ncbi:MAG: hypothetical protein ACREIP_15855 [Alphaproteobacteria bacterium]